ncbi:hypothetical protein ACSNOI_45075 [Actinomadura kijaniata]|uniref:hypothetical protein n=1 Tax=Actinomadura kijaniata TaxID=46161 RepID=UPI003F1C0700
MPAADELLRRIENDPGLAHLLTWIADFDIERRDPVEEPRLPNGWPLTPIAGDGAGGTYFLCGEPGTERPVLYADSEGRASLIAEDLAEAVTLLAAHPYWRDLPRAAFSAEGLAAEYVEGDPDFAAGQARLLALLGVAPPASGEARERLRAMAARTVPDFLPVARHEDPGGAYDSRYDPLF